MTKKEWLIKAKELIKDPKKWCKYYYGANKNGNGCTARSSQAVKWCAMGAVTKVKEEPTLKVVEELIVSIQKVVEKMGYLSIYGLNNDGGHDKVMEMFDILISRHRK